ncbi:aldo/keto reductase [Sphaerimonospora mesophila]|uniref:aldo/keto reductase n=1 Tax=Sphaerimonospora mesophila TaxID=37483 RepID=UPI0007C87818
MIADDHALLDGLCRAVELGATLLDTADWYGCEHAERLIGRFLRECRDLPLILSSKVGRLQGSAPHSYGDRHIHHQLKQSLENLYADCLDLYFLDSFDFGEGDRYLGPAIDQMVTLRELGLIKSIGMRGPHIGYGASPAEQQARAERFLHLFRLIKPNVVWMRYNALAPAIQLEGEDVFDFTRRHGVGPVLSTPLPHGSLTGAATTDQQPQDPTRPPGISSTGHTAQEREVVASGLQALREHFGDAPDMLLALRWCLRRSDHCVVVVGLADAAQMEETFARLGAPLTDAELAAVEEIYAHIHAGSATARHSKQGARALPTRTRIAAHACRTTDDAKPRATPHPLITEPHVPCQLKGGPCERDRLRLGPMRPGELHEHAKHRCRPDAGSRPDRH